MSVANFNLLGTTQIANIGNNRSSVVANFGTSNSENPNFPDSNSLEGNFANLLNGSVLSATAPEAATGASVFAYASKVEVTADSTVPADPVYNILPIIPVKQGLLITPQPGQGPEVSGLPIVQPNKNTGIVIGQGPEVSGLPIVPNGQKNVVIPQVIPEMSPGEKPLVNTQIQIGIVAGKSANSPVASQQAAQVNLVGSTQILAGAVLSPVKSELVGPAASRLENRRAPVSASQPVSSAVSATGQNIPPASSQPLISNTVSVAAQSGQQVPVANNIIAAVTANNQAPIPLAIVPVDTLSIVQARTSDFGLVAEPEAGSSTTINKTALQSSSSLNNLATNPALSAKIGAETVSKFAARLAMRAVGGATKFEMRLDPPQLGRIEVKMEMTSDNRVQAVMIVENPEVLQDMQRSADSLRRALMREGFDLGSNDLEFQLQQENSGSGQQNDDSQEQVDKQVLAQIMSLTSSADIPEIDTGYGYWLVSDNRIDIRV
ncbi:MAG: flagellar hook-length control protein FliK [Robiginitomaculum sp.]|nr:flagellar hook-length control protein FliK [Robiginitomaculum sp.]